MRPSWCEFSHAEKSKEEVCFQKENGASEGKAQATSVKGSSWIKGIIFGARRNLRDNISGLKRGQVSIGDCESGVGDMGMTGCGIGF